MRASPLTLMLAALTSGALGACQVVFGLDDYETAPPKPTSSSTGGEGASGAEGGSGGAGGAGGQGGAASSTASVSSSASTTASTSTGTPGVCPDGFGPEMVVVESGGAKYCVDATEVTRGQYAAWLQTNPASKGQPTACAFNEQDGFAPKSVGSGCSTKHTNVDDNPNHPVVCVDWCDARAYCEASGKRLCAGVSGASYGYADFANASKSEWHLACSNAGTFAYPYGESFTPKRCVGDDFDGVLGNDVSAVASPVKSASECEGGFPGLFDMSGNAWEWEAACEDSGTAAGSDDSCRARGGSFKGGPAEIRCDSAEPSFLRSSYKTDVGFRCCADL